MNFESFKQQVTRPYWSPIHPSKYVQTLYGSDHKSVAMGWGLVYPDDVGSFNLMWLVSGVGAPPSSYRPYLQSVRNVLAISHFPVGGFTLKHRAAICNLTRFADLIQAHPNPAFESLLDAVRLRV